MFVANGLDARLEFTTGTLELYAELINKQFSNMNALTVALWIKVHDTQRYGTILAYCDQLASCPLSFFSGPTLSMKIYSHQIVTNVTLNSDEWTHLAWSWSAFGIVSDFSLFC